MRALSNEERRRKLDELAKDGGHASVGAMLETSALDSVLPAICTEPDCDYTTEMEPDQDAGYCEKCGKNAAASALVLAGLI
jgi:ssDNA-binding Zn-finger/Zn-ribbon topoisomerase 1